MIARGRAVRCDAVAHDRPRGHVGTVDALTAPRRSVDTLITLREKGHRLTLSTIVLYEWLRGPRTRSQLAPQGELFPSEAALAFGAGKRRRRHGSISSCRGREIDLAVAACAGAARSVRS